MTVGPEADSGEVILDLAGDRRSRREAKLLILMAGSILTSVASLVGGAVLAGILADGWARWALFALGALLAWLVIPRPNHAPTGTLEADSAESRAIGSLAGTITDCMSLAPFERILLAPHHSTHAMRVGWGRTPVLVLGVPQWITLTTAERISLIGSEAGRLGADKSVAASMATCADTVLVQLIDITLPASRRFAGKDAAEASHGDLGAFGFADDMAGHTALREATDSAGALGLAVVRKPLQWLRDTLRRRQLRLGARALLQRDRQVQELVGAPALTSMLLSTLSPARGVFAAARALRTGRDPLEALDHVAPPSAEELLERFRRAAHQPSTVPEGRTAQRLAMLGYPEAEPKDTHVPGSLMSLSALADAGIRTLDAQIRAAYKDLLLRGDGL